MAMNFQHQPGNEFSITGHGPGYVAVAGQPHAHSVQLSWQQGASPWPVDRFEAIDDSALRHALAHAPELVLIGTGQRLRFPPPQALRVLIDARIGFEVMDTAAACRTYNVLLGEDRKVAALLLVESPS